MIIKGRIKIFFSREPLTDYNHLWIRTKFKFPNQIFYITEEDILVNEKDYYESNTHDEFNKYIFELLNNKEFLISKGEDMVLKFIKRNQKQLEKSKMNKNIKNMIKEINKNGIEFEMEVKE